MSTARPPLRVTWRTVLAGCLMLAVSAGVLAREPRSDAATPAPVATEEEPLPTLRKVGDACFFGAGAGAASTLIASAPLAANGAALSGLFVIGLGAAGIGCAVGLAGTTAAGTFQYLWESGLEEQVNWWFGLAEPTAAIATEGAR